jgi:hypothetical protein
MTIISTNPKKASKAARQAAGRIRNTKAELLDTITGQHKTILAQTAAMKTLSDRNDINLANWLAVVRDLLRFYDDGVKTTADHERLRSIRRVLE